VGALPGSAGCFKKPTQIPNARHGTNIGDVGHIVSFANVSHWRLPVAVLVEQLCLIRHFVQSWTAAFCNAQQQQLSGCAKLAHAGFCTYSTGRLLFFLHSNTLCEPDIVESPCFGVHITAPNCSLGWTFFLQESTTNNHHCIGWLWTSELARKTPKIHDDKCSFFN
jgi:hypothetical protein